MIWTFHFNLNEAIVRKGGKSLVRCSPLKLNERAKKAAGEHQFSRVFLALFTHAHHGNLCQMI